jgi:molecular chaperone HscB
MFLKNMIHYTWRSRYIATKRFSTGNNTMCKKNYFELFNLPISFNINTIGLKQTYNTLQFKYHPDHTNGSMVESSYINLGYSTLKDDIKRLKYIIELHGKSCDNVQLPSSFLIEYYEYTDIEMSQEQINELVKNITQKKQKLIQDVLDSGLLQRPVHECNQKEAEWDTLITNYAKITFLHNFIDRISSSSDQSC